MCTRRARDRTAATPPRSNPSCTVHSRRTPRPPRRRSPWHLVLVSPTTAPRPRQRRRRRKHRPRTTLPWP
uniref:Uncharacterized protein n=1 Tax=Arundo donax TaxID=35708 RepID=A0A0A9AYV5_ARUDO